MCSTVPLLFVVLFAGVALGYNERYYPNPQNNYFRCGRRSRSYICDPEGVLQYDEAAQLDAELYRIIQDTACPCSSYVCRNNPSGYKVGVAVIKNFKTDENSEDKNPADESTEERRVRMEKLLEQARQIGSTLHERWNLGQCDEDVLLLYSHEDNLIYTVTGSLAREKLNDKFVSDISLDAKLQNYDNFAFKGLMRIVENYRYVLMDQYEPPSRPSSLTGSSPVGPRLSLLHLCSLTLLTLTTTLLFTTSL